MEAGYLAALASILDPPWRTTPLPHVSLHAAGLLALADLGVLAERCALVGGASFSDALVLCPGVHHQQWATELHKGEYPATAALTTGYVFRIENPATVSFLQRSSRAGHLTPFSVSPLPASTRSSPQLPQAGDPPAVRLLYASCVLLTLAAAAALAAAGDSWAVAVLALLSLARLLNVLVVRRRAARGGRWKGQTEPGVQGDLLVLLSQDRWARLRGAVDDLKAVTSGLWLADPAGPEAGLTALATVLVHAAAALAWNATQLGSLVLVALLPGSAVLLGLANARTRALRMHGRELRVDGPAKSYERRRELADELIGETGRRDWAVALGMVPAQEGDEKRAAVM